MIIKEPSVDVLSGIPSGKALDQISSKAAGFGLQQQYSSYTVMSKI